MVPNQQLDIAPKLWEVAAIICEMIGFRSFLCNCSWPFNHGVEYGAIIIIRGGDGGIPLIEFRPAVQDNVDLQDRFIY